MHSSRACRRELLQSPIAYYTIYRGPSSHVSISDCDDQHKRLVMVCGPKRAQSVSAARPTLCEPQIGVSGVLDNRATIRRASSGSEDYKSGEGPPVRSQRGRHHDLKRGKKSRVSLARGSEASRPSSPGCCFSPDECLPCGGLASRCHGSGDKRAEIRDKLKTMFTTVAPATLNLAA
ncbi:hypothetical protein VTI28DRAFT_2644 [Corynascus sepedonium]